MANTFFFYDLETSGINTRTDRIMQFAGQRTDMQLQPLGEPVNILIKLTPDTVPDPDAILITGITPQMTQAEGITEAAFVRQFQAEIATPGTIFVGFNTVRFDDEFMRCLLYRNFCDAYTWQWKDDRSRWDMLDVVRMTRALRPEGINWPVGAQGEVTNRLELLTQANNLDHQHAHDALNDVHATIAVAQLIKKQQPKLFDYLLQHRTKQAVKSVVQPGKSFVYTSGKYPKELQHTTVGLMLAERPDGQGALIYDLRTDPEEFLDKSPAQLAAAWQYTKDPAVHRLPVKTLKYNRCPAVARLSVLQVNQDETLQRLQLNLKQAHRYANLLLDNSAFTDKLFAALKILDEGRAPYEDAQHVDTQLYDSLPDNRDTRTKEQLCAAEPTALDQFVEKFHDSRLQALVPLYKARNFPDALTREERQIWDAYCYDRLLSGGEQSRLGQYFARLGELAETADEGKRFLLEELQLYGQAIMPVLEDT